MGNIDDDLGGALLFLNTRAVYHVHVHLLHQMSCSSLGTVPRARGIVIMLAALHYFMKKTSRPIESCPNLDLLLLQLRLGLVRAHCSRAPRQQQHMHVVVKRITVAGTAAGIPSLWLNHASSAF